MLRFRTLIFHLAWLILPGAATCLAGGGPENVAVVVNSRSWSSLAVANRYVALRHVPAGNVIYLDDVPDVEQVDVDTFRSRILLPVLQTIEARGLAPQIDYVVYSSDLPPAIDVSADVGSIKIPPVFTPIASINGLTCLYEQVLAKDVNYLQLNANRYFRSPLAGNPKPLDEAARRELQQAVEQINGQKWSEAATLLDGLIQRHGDRPELHYNLACCLARQEKPDDAVAALARAVDAGWLNRQHTETDDDLTALRERDDYKALLTRMADVTFDVRPSVGFRRLVAWNEAGEPAEQGRRYLLSTMLGVTSGRGNSVTEVFSSLDRAAAADGTRPAGTIYFPVNGDIRSTTRASAYKSAVAALEKLGVAAQIVDGVLPQDKPDVQGAMVGIADFQWPAANSTILPGAICEHLTSFGGVLSEGAGQTPLTEFIRHGAAGASGTVTEPYAIQAKFPFAFLHVHYARGCTLAEAFYQSVWGPYQLLIVGDPLCRPWADIPTVEIRDLPTDRPVSGRIECEGVATNRDGAPAAIGRWHWYLDGRWLASDPAVGKLALDTSILPDGFHELRAVAHRTDAIETQGRVVATIWVDNRGDQIEIQSSAPAAVTVNDAVPLSARCPDAASIQILHNLRVVATIDGSDGQVSVPARMLGQGASQLIAVATIPGTPERRVHSRPVNIMIHPPATQPAVPLDSQATFAPGLKLTRPHAEPAVIDDLRPGDWLSKLAVEPGQPVTLEGVWDVPTDDVYQFQINGNCRPAISVDGRRLEFDDRDGWQSRPVALAAGAHRLKIEWTQPEAPRLQVRFGGLGLRLLNGGAFRHEE